MNSAVIYSAQPPFTAIRYGFSGEPERSQIERQTAQYRYFFSTEITPELIVQAYFAHSMMRDSPCQAYSTAIPSRGSC